jgi:integrase
MSHYKPYSLFKRGKIFYCQFRNADGSRSVPKSTGESVKGRAESWAIEYLKSHHTFIDKRISLSEYANGFYDDDGHYAINKRNAGKRINSHHLKERRDIMKNHILPSLGQMILSDIKYKNLEQYRNDKFKAGYSGSFISKHLQTINSILKEACRDEVIQAPPLLPECTTAVLKRKGCLTVDEVKQLFTIGTWQDHRSFTASLLSASTGLRLGEVQGLVLSDLNLNDGHLLCRRSFDYRNRKLNATTKTGRSRTIILPSKVIDALNEMISKSPYTPTGESYVFWADFEENNPTERNRLVRDFYKALNSIGITETIRKERNITFHSHRHFYNSLLVNSRIPLNKIQAQTGHLSTEMTERYYHVTLGELSEIREIQEQLLS